MASTYKTVKRAAGARTATGNLRLIKSRACEHVSRDRRNQLVLWYSQHARSACTSCLSGCISFYLSRSRINTGTRATPTAHGRARARRSRIRGRFRSVVKKTRVKKAQMRNIQRTVETHTQKRVRSAFIRLA